MSNTAKSAQIIIFVLNCLFVFVLFLKGVLGTMTYLKSRFASAIPVMSAVGKRWKCHDCIICSPLEIHSSVNSWGAALLGGFVDTVSLFAVFTLQQHSEMQL